MAGCGANVFTDLGPAGVPPGVAVVRWVPCGAVPDGWLAMLDAAERERAGGFRFAADRAAFIAAHALVRAMLGQAMLGQPGRPAAAHWHFGTGPAGKPEIDPASGPGGLRFNLSHTRGLAACVVMRDVEVGVDLEALDRRHDGRAIADRYFKPEEVAELAAHPDGFLRLWTLKESVMKATGQGFGLALNAFAVTLNPPGVRFVAGPRGQWSFHQQAVGTGHVLAVAARAGGVRFDTAAACAMAAP